MKSIQTKLTVIILAIFLVALGAMGGLNYWKAHDILARSITTDIREQAGTVAGDISDWLEARKAEMTIMSLSPVVQAGNPETIVPYLIKVVNANKIYDTIGYIKPDGAYLNSSGAKGSLVDRDYFQKAIKGESVVSDPVVSKATGKAITVVAVPVKVDGRVAGVLYGSIGMDGLNKKVLDIKIAQTGYAMVTQGDGLRIIHPSKELAMKSNPLKDANAEPGQKKLTEVMVKGEKGLMTLKSSAGIVKYYSYAPVPGTAWSLAICVPVAEVTDALDALTVISLVTIVAVLLIASLVVAWVARRIARPIRDLEAAADRVAGGDVSEIDLSINTNDEIGRLARSFEQMTLNLRTLIQKTLGATEQVAASSEQLTASADQSAQAANNIAASITAVATGADNQLAAVDEASAAVEQLSATIRQITTSTDQVAAQSAQAAEKAEDGNLAVEKAVTQMNTIENTVVKSAQVVTKLGERSKEIGQIVDTIAGIAGQTNLLALNAAIEAARAGEQGRGFAVVAEEVRKLAEQSQEAAMKIADLIGEIQGDTDDAVVAMNGGTREVATGAEIVNAAGVAFREIVALVQRVSDQMKDITAASQQMATGSQQIVGAVKRINDLSKTSAGEAQGVSAAAEEQLASMEEIASSSQSLAKLAQDLQDVVAKFRI